MARKRLQRGDLKTGQTVKVTLTGTVRNTYAEHSCVEIYDGTFTSWVYPNSSKVEIVEVFTPKVGEVYLVGFKVWLVATSLGSTQLVSEAGIWLSPESFAESYGERAVRARLSAA